MIAFVGAVGVDLKRVEVAFEERLKSAGYKIVKILIAYDIFSRIDAGIKNRKYKSEFQKISKLMDFGNKVRKKTKENGFLSMGVAAQIKASRGGGKVAKKTAYLVRSLKRPEEVRVLREIYPLGFYLVGVHADRNSRKCHLVDCKHMAEVDAESLMERDINEKKESGQRIIDTFHLSDFFVRLEANADRLVNSVWRIVDLMFGNPYRTPAFSEHAMFLAYASSLRSADLSRQVGAVIARDGEILATGANDCPKAGGGLYWPFFDQKSQKIIDSENGRDFKLEEDSNKKEQNKIIDSIVEGFLKKKALKLGSRKRLVRSVLEGSAISDLIEFGRVVHAEMEALLSCARKGIPTKGATMYCTTFPCHNCAKHIVAAGIERVIFIEPYLKSKAIKLHKDSIEIDYADAEGGGGTVPNRVKFQPFVGVGPRRFFDLFSISIGMGNPIKRKTEKGDTIPWEVQKAKLRIQMLPKSYIDSEAEADRQFNQKIRQSLKS